jgi:two-component system sensor histidine kinase KdpD
VGHNQTVRRVVWGSVIGIGLALLFAAVMLPVRSHLSIATAGLVLVVPVVAGVVTGGFTAGLISVAAGFLVYDIVFIPPYGTLTVGAAQNWVALAVYTVTMVLVATVVANLDDANAASRARAASARQLLDISELLLVDQPVPELSQTIVDAVRNSFGFAGVALLVSTGGRLEVAAESGEPVGDAALSRFQPGARVPVSLSTDRSEVGIHTLALATSGRPVGLLALAGRPVRREMREVLLVLANQLALALERAQLHERVRRAELLEEADRLRHALVGAVSHDLCTPLATIKVASSTLVNPAAVLTREDTAELHDLIDTQADRLTRIVDNVLDMTRVQAGVLEPRCEPWSVAELLAECIGALRPSLDDRLVELRIPPWLPPVYVDHALVEQVLANLLENADRHGPPGTAITVEAKLSTAEGVTVSVTDRGLGVRPDERDTIFDTFVHFDTGGRAGLGLAIAKAFVEAHGGRIWVEEAPGGGARFVFSLPVAATNGSPH